jgi:sugar transferase (PEP-CTERM/EpsH1 system associated)
VNILYISHCVPFPPDKGEKIRAFHQIRYLSREHTIHLACLITDPNDANYLKNMEEYCASVDAAYRNPRIATLLSGLSVIAGKPFSVGSFYSRDLKKKIVQRLRSTKLDCILVFTSSMAQYVRHVSAVPKLIDFVDVDSELWRLSAGCHPFPFSWVHSLEATRLARYEEAIARIFDHSIFASKEEARIFQPRASGRFVSVVPNGVDFDCFSQITHEAPLSDYPILLFMGTMDYFPNVDAVRYFCREILPLIQKQLPSTHFEIVGRCPTRNVRRLAKNRQVTVTGPVTDVRPYLARAAIMVAPFRIARGIQNKVLEAMASGLPVVGTSVAFQGLDEVRSAGVHVADDPQEFALKVIALLKDPESRRRCVLQAAQYVKGHHQLQDQGARLSRLLLEVAGGTSTETTRSVGRTLNHG